MDNPHPCPEAKDTVFSEKEVAKFSSILWAIAGVIGILVMVLPHGPKVEVTGWVALTVFAFVVSIAIAIIGERQPKFMNYALSVTALAAVSGAVAASHGSPIAYAVCSLYLLPTIFSASFYETRAFLIYLVAQCGVAAAVLFTSGLPGAPAAWVVLIGTISTIGWVVHVLQQALKVAASTDPLTGLVNRRAFEPVLTRELARCARLDHPLSLVLLDLDHFKAVNDERGHQEGDRALVEVSQAWCEQLRDTDVLARSGGDEFILMLPSTGWAQAMDVLARLSRSSSVQFSAGIAVAEPGSSIESVLRSADDACYKAKRKGRAQVVLAEGSYNPRVQAL